MSFREILASLATAPAERFGKSNRLGQIAAGLQADPFGSHRVVQSFLVVKKKRRKRNHSRLNAFPSYPLRRSSALKAMLCR